MVGGGAPPEPIVRIELFRRSRHSRSINLASAVMYLVTFSVMLIAPYFLAALHALWHFWGGIAAGAVLATRVYRDGRGVAVGRLARRAAGPARSCSRPAARC